MSEWGMIRSPLCAAASHEARYQHCLSQYSSRLTTL
jgi:hypothetical protein